MPSAETVTQLPDTAFHVQLVLDIIFHVSSSSSKVLVSNTDFTSCSGGRTTGWRSPYACWENPGLIDVSLESFQFVIRHKKEYAGQTPSRRWRPRCWRRRWRTWGAARFVSKPSKSATRSSFSLISGFTTLSTSRRSSTLAALDRVSMVVTLVAYKDGYRGS